MLYHRPDMSQTVPMEPQNKNTYPCQSRLDDMLERYGECCTQTKAAHILGKSSRTISRMLEDGRLRRIDTSVDVRSIVHYLENPRKNNFMAQAQKKRPNKKHPWDSFAVPL